MTEEEFRDKMFHDREFFGIYAKKFILAQPPLETSLLLWSWNLYFGELARSLVRPDPGRPKEYNFKDKGGDG